MGKYSEVFVGIDTAKKKHAVAIVDAGRDGEHGEIDSASATIERLIKKLASKYERCESAKLDRRVMGSIGRL
jgi:transposase